MADKDLTIGIKVTADTKGAADAAKAISDAMEAANKKPFQMPIDEAGMKAREEAMRLQQQQTAEDAKSIPVAEAVAKARRQIGETNKEAIRQNVSLIASQRQEIGVIQSATVTANGAKKAKEELGKSGKMSASGVLALSNAFQDAQYGMAGLINNIPMIVSGMGFGMGLAGAAQAAAVGVQILSKNFDLLGTEEAKAAEETKKNQEELNKLANEARIAAEKSEALAKSQRELANELRNTTTAYDEATAAAERAFRKQEEMADAEMKRTDAAFERAVAMIDLQEAGGEISAGEATQKRAGARSEATARREKIEIERLKAAEELANNEAYAAKFSALRATAIADEMLPLERGRQILTKEQYNEQLRLRDAQQKQLTIARKDLEETERIGRTGLQGKDAADYLERQKEKRMAAERRIADTAEALAQTQEKLRKDQEAKERTGATSQEDFAEKRKQMETEALEFRKKQEAATEAAASAAFRRSTLEQLAPMRAETEAMRTSAAERTRQAEEKRKADEAAAERAKQVGEAGAAGSKLAEALAGSANPAFVRQLAGASSSGDIGALIALVEKLMANQRTLTDQQRSRLQKLEAEIEDLRTAK